MPRFLTLLFFLGLLVLLAGYATGGTQSDSRIFAFGWFCLLWPALTLLLTLPLGLLRRSGARTAPPNPGRRRLLHRAGTLVAAVASGPMAVQGIAQAARAPSVRRVAVSVAGRHPDLDGFRIVHISDLHVDRWTPGKRIERLVDRVNRLRPHVVALTGDLADDPVALIRPTVAPLREIRAPFGRYFVTGNHEYRTASGGVNAWIDEIRRLGFSALLNEHRIVCPGKACVAIAGVCDYEAGASVPGHRSCPGQAARGTGHADYRILLAHQPRSLFDAADAGFDLQLSGHTHGGQCFPAHLLVCLTQPVLCGLHRHRQMDVYVTAGVGTWGAPFRLGAPAEVALLVLKGT